MVSGIGNGLNENKLCRTLLQPSVLRSVHVGGEMHSYWHVTVGLSAGQ